MSDRVWIDERVASAIHDRLLTLHGGPAGRRVSVTVHCSSRRWLASGVLFPELNGYVFGAT